MSEQISSLIVKVDTKTVNQASKELDKFSKKVEKAASTTDNFGESLDSVKARLKKAAKEIDDIYKRIEEYRKSLIANTNSTVKFTESSDKLYESFINQIDGMKKLSAASKDLSKINNDILRSYKDKNLEVNNYRKLLADVAVKQKDVTISESAATRAKVNFINRLKEQSTFQDMTEEQLLRYKANQLGINSSTDIYIKKLTEAKITIQELGTEARVTRQQITTMAAQLLRSDISGLKSSRINMSGRSGGIGNVFKSITSSISPVQIGITGLITGGIALAKAYYQGSQELSNFNKTIVMTGNYAGVTTNQVATMAKKIGSEIGYVSDAASALIAALSVNKFKGENLELVAKTATNLQKNIGKSVDETISEFKRLAEDPVSAVVELNEKYNSFTADIYQQIIALQQHSDAIGAQELAIKTHADTLNTRTNNITANLGYIERAWDAVSDATKTALEAMKNFGRRDTLDEQIEQENNNYMAFINREQSHRSLNYDAYRFLVRLYKGNLASLKKLKEKDDNQATLEAQITEANAVDIEYQRLTYLYRKKNLSIVEAELEVSNEFNNAIAARNRLIATGNTNLKEYTAVEEENLWNAIASKYSVLDKKKTDTKTTSTTNLLNASKQQEISLQNQLRALHKENTTVATITSERKKYFDLQAQIQTLESSENKSKLSAQEKYVLANKQALLAQYAKNAAIADEVNQYQTATNALRNMKEYSIKVASEAKVEQITFGMTSKNENRYNQLSELDSQREIALKGTINPNEIAKVTEEYTKAKQALQQRWQQEDINQGDWVTGLMLGLEQYAESAQNVFGAATNFAQQSMNSLSSMMTTLVTTGKANFQDFAKSILTNLIEIINKLIIAQTIQTALGWVRNRALAQSQVSTLISSSGLFYDGGLVKGYASGGSVGYSDRPGGFTGIGDKYMPAGVVHKGEFVFTKEATQRLGVGNLYGLMEKAERGYANGGYVDGGFVTPAAFNNGGSNSTAVNVNANVSINMPSYDNKSSNSSNSNLQAATGQLEAIIQQKIGETLKKSVSVGGDMYNVIKAIR